MKLKLINKKKIQEMKFDEHMGMINLYACSHCKKVVMYFYMINGKTPTRLTCDNCGGDAFSQLPRVRQADRFWYRPNDIRELMDLTGEAYESVVKESLPPDHDTNKEKDKILKDYVKWYNMGGLFARSIVR